MTYTVALPAPTTDNRRLVLGRGGKRTLSLPYRQWRDDAAIAMRARASELRWQTATTNCTVHAVMNLHGNRDIQNCAKALCDALTLAGIYDDDRRIAKLVLERDLAKRLPRGEIEITVSIDLSQTA